VLVLMDYHFGKKINNSKYDAQKHYMAKRSKEFELIQDDMADTTTAIFRYLG